MMTDTMVVEVLVRIITITVQVVLIVVALTLVIIQVAVQVPHQVGLVVALVVEVVQVAGDKFDLTLPIFKHWGKVFNKYGYELVNGTRQRRKFSN